MITLPRALRLAIRLNAWKTTPRMWRRYSENAGPCSSLTTVDPNSIAPARRGEQTGQARKECRLAAARRPEQHHELAVVGLEIQSVERLNDVATRVEGNGEVLDQQVVVHPKAVRGSAPVTRRKGETLAITPTVTAISGSTARALPGVMSTASAKSGPMKRERISARMAAQQSNDHRLQEQA